MTSTSSDVLAGALPGLLALAALFALLAADGIAGVAVALPRAALLLVAEAEARDVDLRDRDRDEVLALAPDELALRDVLPEVLPDLAADDRAEARVVLVDLQRHRWRTFVIVAGLSTSGCSALFNVDAGYAHAFAQAPERSAATVDARIGVGGGGDHGGAGVGWSVRSEVERQRAAVLARAISLRDPRHGAQTATRRGRRVPRRGLRPRHDRSRSPRCSGVDRQPVHRARHVRPREGVVGITLAVRIEDDIRFDATPNTAT